ncbi:hypothetical protein F4556_007297 [Kitasatospora gansuensis]|uniref:Uncharacterized protein n=1 Tax=Kitasatospora gansuensis TaxID=258050 RepID=A0A7W7WLF9_9ACTN|nr:hypothetical protein [Kitasatospora gansuensis]MBB4951762.1 hypothetical protein [Kitasatospora gansuensis]
MRITIRAAQLLTAVVALFGLAFAATPASATTGSGTWNLPGGDRWQVNAWHCGVYQSDCSWSASTKLLGNSPARAKSIQNRAELEAHGIRASIKISKAPSATLTMKSRSLGEVRWRNTNTWISDTSGSMHPGGITSYVSVRSCGSGQVTSSINVSEKCVYAGAF